MTETHYAGDKAWEEWFRICSVSGCAENQREPLSVEIRSAMLAQLRRTGVFCPEAERDDPILFFDSYFLLKGSRDKQKPLKQYFLYRIRAEGLRMRDFVCGTLFGSASGRIHDIVINWVAHLKGWTPHTLRDAEGKRHVTWEGATEEEQAELTLPVETNVADLIDVEPIKTQIQKALSVVSLKLKMEKPKVGLLLYATAQDISLTDATILESLNVAKSRAYKLRDKVLETFQKQAKSCEEAGSPLFGRVLLEECEALAQGALNRRKESAAC